MTGHRHGVLGFVGVLGVLALITVSCGDDGTTAVPGDTSGGAADSNPVDDPVTDPVVVPVAAKLTSSADPNVAGEAISDFGQDLFESVRTTSETDANIAISPASIAFALAMVEPGTVGAAQTQLRALLRIEDPVVFHAAMNALEQSLEGRLPTEFTDSDDPGEVAVRIANAAYLQRGYPFEAAYLEAVGSSYGPVLNEVDFAADPDAVAHQINDFVARETNDRIPQLIDDGVIRPETVLALVNALYLKASWVTSFDEATTADQTFTTLSAAAKTVPMMHGGSDSSASGDGWVGAKKNYTGDLTAQFILPDDGRFEEIANDLHNVFINYDTTATSGATLDLPRFDLRFGAELTPALMALGLTAPYARGGLLGIANDPKLIIDKVIHQTNVAMDEDGTEAAAATVVLIYPTSAPPKQPVPVILGRPFLYRIIDNQTGATLFIGQVMDPAS